MNQDNCLVSRKQGGCYECHKGNKLIDETFKCISNGNNENCSLWREPNNDRCLRCKDGLYFNEKTNYCKTCPIECKTCLNSSYCFSCNDGYYISESGTCISTNTIVENCRQIIDISLLYKANSGRLWHSTRGSL